MPTNLLAGTMSSSSAVANFPNVFIQACLYCIYLLLLFFSVLFVLACFHTNRSPQCMFWIGHVQAR